MKSDIVLSINIPTYNRSSYLNQLLSCLVDELNGSIHKVEINILDNASGDDTESVVIDYKSKLPINYIRHEKNLGPMKNIHLAHRIGEGKYVWVFGDDDYIKKGALKKIMNALDDAPAVVLLSYSRETPAKKLVNKVSSGNHDLSMTKNSADFSIAVVDNLIGFLTANIVERKWIDLVSPEEYEELDTIGELAHSTIVYQAIGANETVKYIAGEPIVQTVDNSYLKHDYWIIVCVKYCIQLPIKLQSLGFEANSTKQYFRKRLIKECMRRVLSEKYRGNDPKVVVKNPIVKGFLGTGLTLFLSFLTFIPSVFIKKVYDTVYMSRG